MAANERSHHGNAGPSFSWWAPRPLSTVCALLVGAALAVMLTLDQALGKPPARRYGWPLIYRFEPSLPVGTGLPSWFDPISLVVDIAVAAGILASSYCTAQWLTYRLIGPSRYTVRSASLTIAAVAVLLALSRSTWLLTVFVLLGAFLYGLVSPLLLIAILLCRKLSSGHGPIVTGHSRDGGGGS